MRKAMLMGLSLSVAVVGLSSVASAQEPAPVPPPSPSALTCDIQLEPAAVPVRDEAVKLSVILSQAIGETLSARLDGNSGVQVVSVELLDEERAAPARAVSLTLNTARAVAGEWVLTLEGEDGRRCSGTVKVEADG